MARPLVLSLAATLASGTVILSCSKRQALITGINVEETAPSDRPTAPQAACQAPTSGGGPTYSRACLVASGNKRLQKHPRLKMNFQEGLRREKNRLIALDPESAQKEINTLLLEALRNQLSAANATIDARKELLASLVDVLAELRGGLSLATVAGSPERERLTADLTVLMDILQQDLPAEVAQQLISKQKEILGTVPNSLPGVASTTTAAYQAEDRVFVAPIPLRDSENDALQFRCVNMDGTSCPSDVVWQNDTLRIPARFVSNATPFFVFQLSDGLDSKLVSFTLQLDAEVVGAFSTQEIAGLAAEPQSTSVVRLRWNPPPSGSRVLVSYSNTAEPAERCELQTGATVTEMAENATSFELSGLAASSTVFARVCLSSSATPLLFSAGSVSQSQTLKANPSDVSLLNLTSLVPGSLSVSWGELAASDLAVVTWAQLPTPAPACQASNGAQNAVLTGTSTLLSGLAEGAEYAVRHCVFRSGAALPLSSGVVAQARVRTALPPQPASLTATVVSDTRLRFQWTSGGGTTTGFVLALTPGALGSDTCFAAPELSHTLAVGTTEFEFENLNPNAQYTASLCALNSNTPAEKSSARFATATTLKTLSSISLSPSSVSLIFPATQAVTVTAHYTDASSEDVTAQSVFSLDDAAVGAVSAGEFTTASTGSTTLRASFGGQEVASTVEVSAQTLTVSPLFPNHGAAWMSYVEVSNPGAPFASTDTACTAAPGTAHWGQDCLHGGELRTSTWTGLGSCEGLVASDSLNVFRWRCEDLGNNIRFVSLGFKKGKGLKDLVLATSWRQNALVVQKDGRTVAGSSNAQWWTNPVTEAPNNAATSATMLTSSNTIYTIANSRDTRGYGIQTHRVALVTLPGVELRWAAGSPTHNFNSSCGTGTPSQRAMVCVGNSTGNWPTGNWLEVSLNALATDTSRATYGLKGGALRSVVHGSTVINAQEDGAFLDGVASLFRDSQLNLNVQSGFRSSNSSTAITLLNVEAHKNGLHGLSVGDSARMQIVNVKATNNAQHGIHFDSGAGYYDSSHVNLFAAHNGGDGIHFDNISGQLRSAKLTAVSNAGHGIVLDEGDDVFAFTPTALNNGGAGLYFSGYNYYDIIENPVLVGNGTVGVVQDTASTFFNYIALIGRSLFSGADAAERCQVSNGGVPDVHPPEPPLDATCMPSGPLVVTTVVDLLLKGLLGTDDPANSSDSASPTPVGSIVDWSNFSQGLRYWGRDSSDAFLSASQRGPCTGSCRIYDLAPAGSQSPLLFRGLSGSADPFMPGDACPANAHGDLSRGVYEGGEETKFALHSAVEIVGDYIGNENGLCESNEACVYMPHQSPWAGEGDPLSQGQCLFQNGRVSGVTLYAAPQPLP